MERGLRECERGSERLGGDSVEAVMHGFPPVLNNAGARTLDRRARKVPGFTSCRLYVIVQ